MADVVGVGLLIIGIDPGMCLGDIGHTLDKEQRCENQTCTDRDNQIKYDRQHDRRHQHGNITLRGSFEHGADILPAAHIICNNEQDCGDCRHRNHGRIRHQNDQNAEHNDGMHHTGNRGSAAVLDVRGGSCDRTGCGDSAEERRADIRNALRDQLHIGTVLRADHTVRNDAGEQRFNGCQNRNRERIGQHGADAAECDMRQREFRGRIGDCIEIADRIDMHPRELYDRCTENDRDQRGGNLLKLLRPENQHRKRQQADQQRRDIERSDAPDNLRDLIYGLNRRILEGQAEKILDLTDHNRDGNAECKSRGNRAGDVFEQLAESANAHDDQQDARHDRRKDQAVHAVRRDDPGNDRCKCRGRTGNLHTAAAEERDQESGDNRGIETLLRIDTGSKRKRDGKRQRYDRDDHARDQVLDKLRLRVGFHDRKELRFELFGRQLLSCLFHFHLSVLIECPDIILQKSAGIK